MTTTTRLIPTTALDNVRKPLAEASGMPNAVYDDASLYELERDEVLGKGWAALGFTSDLPMDGFAKPYEFMGLPLAIMRNRDGEFKVFHNVCNHRGMILLTEETEVEGMVRCPYHSWTYDLNGNLKGTPHIGGYGKHKAEGFVCEKHGLREVRSHVWAGMVFINLSGDAVDFDTYIEPLKERWSDLCGREGWDNLNIAPTGSQMQLEVKCNWKLAVENYCESYHLPWVHPSLNTYSPLDQHYNLVVSDNMSGQGSHTYNLSDVAGTHLPRFPSWPQDRLRQAEYISLYPNVLLGLQADHFFAIILEPKAHDRTLENLRVFYVGEEACGDEYAACRHSQIEAWRVVFGEDVFAVEGMQVGRRSPGFQGGVFSPVLDGPTHHFHNWVANRYASALEG
ncbi:SRPBCC family protein [Marinobacter sp.]|uniref:aromatic ring-hydroxylating oxygenase subunit alpha n=1 Tax=Marinobacter sp. TaxID=50741 RepID=UPI0032992A93